MTCHDVRFQLEGIADSSHELFPYAKLFLSMAFLTFERGVKRYMSMAQFTCFLCLFFT